MNTPLYAAMLLGLALTFSCKDTERVVETGPDASAADMPRLGGPAPADSLVFMLRKSPCFGHCKAYQIEVYRSGYAVYNGNSNVEKIGMHTGRIGPDTLKALVAEADRIGFFGLEDKYDAPVTDLPSTVIRVVANGKDKEVTGRVGTPEDFKALAAQAEELLLPVPWRPVPAKD
ncbi:MAG: hypothetical protein KDB84_06405 [Flavobacteriales bacterium]|nr:hypothetical protein [Flavobacteriales bacterium]